MAAAPSSNHHHGKVPNCKMVVVGDGSIGKTCLLMAYTKDIFPEEYVPTVFDNYSQEKEVEIKDPKPQSLKVRLDLWDTAGQEEFDRIRPLSYRDANFFLICFSVVSIDSFEHVMGKWVPEVKHHAPHKSFLLVGLKSDLRKDDKTLQELKDKGQAPVPLEKVMACVKETGAEGYVECSALKKINVDMVFDTAMRRFYYPTKPKKKKSKECMIQ